MEIDRLAELDKLVKRPRGADDKANSDIDLILSYLERYVSDPKIGGGSKKLKEFEITPDNNTATTNYTISWRKYDNE